MNTRGTIYVNSEAAAKSGERISFSFGRNWQSYLKTLDEEQIDAAQRSFVESTGFTSLAGQSFLDAGCGSGLSSLVALRLGADKVISFDIDPASIGCAAYLRSVFAPDPRKWEIHPYSLLDPTLPQRIGQTSVVCCWGAAHHSGRMWEAVDNVSRCVAERGTLLLAIYNRTRHSSKWLALKRFYNWSPSAIKTLMLTGFHARTFASLLLHGENPRRYLTEYVHQRGMTYFRDVEDWLGGLPYEYATIEEMRQFLTYKGFDMLAVKPARSHGCNEFIFKRADDRA